jgi:hypothetical protein
MPRPNEPCPICGKPADPLHRPFCSRGCRDRDLLQWLGEGYRLPGGDVDPDGLDSGAEHP